MERICPQPMTWHRIHQSLLEHAREHRCDPPAPPAPLILAGWTYSNDVEKRARWQATVSWCISNGCAGLMEGTPDEEFYFTSVPTSYMVGPMGGPVYRPWDFEPKTRPGPQELSRYLLTLNTRWDEIAGAELATVTRPLAFSGAKRRRLMVERDEGVLPPWGAWDTLSPIEAERRTFTAFRKRMNEMIAPHEVDHICFLLSAPSRGADMHGTE